MEQCKECYRDTAGGCEAYKHRPKDCWAKLTDREQYIKEQRELIAYNRARESTVPCKQAYKNIKRVLRGRANEMS